MNLPESGPNRVWTPELRERASQVEAILLDVDGVLTDGTFVPADEESGLPEIKRFHARDGLGLLLARRSGIRLGFVTGRTSQIVRRRAQEIGAAFLREGCFTKGVAFEDACRSLSLAASQVAFIGDDVQDLPAMRRAGFAAAPSDAHPRVLAEALYVSDFPGGRGAVRQVVERILEARGALETAWASFGD